MKNWKCLVRNHDFGNIVPIYTGYGPNGLIIGYMAYICKRCRLIIPASQEDKEKQNKVTEDISNIMNAERVRIGLHPISWKNRN